ncbi:uncharacterized protein [Eucyclogobius newberryi]|uniref:uncharacterized protein n=1 Tax=Eucyclogobius newberryi TaxID=166745 RepID=UPI003B5B4EF2
MRVSCVRPVCQVRAHFTAVVTGPCASVTGLCAAGDDCLVETNTVPFTGSKPGSGWCSHQWQKTVAANFRGPISLGSSTEMYVALKAEPVVRANNGKLNHPAFVALPPPLRVREKCPHHFPLSVRDLDGDRVRCRFAKEDQGECVKCPAHSFVELDQEKCSLSFTGDAAVGLYHVFLMVEDLVPAPQSVQLAQSRPMSAVPFILSLSVEKAQHRCSAEPMTSGDTLDHNSVLYMLPFHQKSFTVNYDSNQESVTEIAVIGPPELYRTGFLSLGPVSSLNIAWVRSVNQLARLLPVCFVANTANLQSDPRCVWLYQREMMALPTGTELNCGKAEMSLALPISSFSNIDISELQLNSPTCPITYNATYLTARIPLEGCGTKTVHSGDELIYTNTLQTVRTYSKVIRRQPVLVLPLACRIPGIQAKGPKYEVGIPKEKEVFGEVEFKLEFHFPGQGPLGKFTRRPVFRRVRRELQEDDLSAAASDGTSSSASTTPSASNNASATTSYIPQLGSKIDTLDLYVTSNCTVSRAEMLVSSCIQSETEDFTNSSTLLDQG